MVNYSDKPLPDFLYKYVLTCFLCLNYFFVASLIKDFINTTL